MSVDDAINTLEFWNRSPWPMPERQVKERASELGWVVGPDGLLVNGVDALTFPSVMVLAPEAEQATSVSFWLTDVIEDPTDEDAARLNDLYTLLIRRGRELWGRGKSLRRKGYPYIQWEPDTGARITVMLSKHDISATIDTPYYAQVLRDLGE